MELENLYGIKLGFYFAVNKLQIDKRQNIFDLIAEHFGFIKYSFYKPY